MNGNTIRTITIRGQAEGLDKLTADINKLAAAEQNVAVVSEQSAKRVLSLEDAWKRQTLKLDEAARSQANIARETKLADQALREGLATQAQHAQRLEQINQRYATASQSTQQFATQTGLARHELINLGRQAQDVGVSLVSGQSPLMILAQQGTQIADVFISSGKSVGAFFSQAFAWGSRFFSLTGAIVTGLVGLGAAAVYAATQFLGASRTIEQTLEEQNRLLKEGKALIDARTSAEARAQLQPKQLTEFEITRNLLDLQTKLNKEREAAERRVSRPTQVPGEMGEAPTGVTGVKEFVSAFEALNTARAAGLPGLKEYMAELGKIGQANPALATTVEKMIELARTGLELEQAEMRLRAIADAAKGVATNAQLAAVGLGSIAQFKLSTLQADQAREATERHAKAVLNLVGQYGNLGPVAAQQVHALEQQLQLTQARTEQERMSIQFNQTLLNADLNRITAAEALRIATLQRANAIAQANNEAMQTLKTLQQENELIKAGSDFEKDRIKARQTYQDLIDKGVDRDKARAVASQQLANANEQRAQREQEDADKLAESTRQRVKSYKEAADAAQREADQLSRAAEAARRAAQEIMKFVPFGTSDSLMAPYVQGKNIFQSNQGGMSQFNPAGYTSSTSFATALNYAATSRYGTGGFDATTGAPNAQGIQKVFNEGLAKAGGDFSKLVSNMLGGDLTSGPIMGGAATLDMNMVGLLNRAIEILPKDQQISSYQREVGMLQQQGASLETSELIKQLNDKLAELTKSTDANTSATATMTDVLSPFYSSDPRNTHLGFRAFAGGGIMSQYGELPIRHYQGGGMATSPQVAVFGENSTPEAYVPVPSGRIPVELKVPANSNKRPVNVNIYVQGNADQNTVSALRSTAFQQAQAMRRMM